MAHGIDAAMNPDQLTTLNPALDDVVAVSSFKKLPPRNDAVLHRCHDCQATWLS